MKSALKKGWRWLLGGLLGLLGFEGCDLIGLGRCEYGQPHADYKLVGYVTDTKAKAIPGIRVVFAPRPDDPEGWYNDTLYTDSKGYFERERLKYDWPDDLKNAVVKYEDVDGAENGSYKTLELRRDDFQVKQSKKGDKNWYDGAFTIQADAILEKED